ncbi:MAG: pantetheine-phosphate adenylyltransferase [Clostridia bacterium]|nr:pantetheine-phosphate adenylyltransferase [Clostridia bacterium]
MECKKERAVLVPGSFGPVTKGHEDLIKKACLLGDKVYVTAMVNPRKTTLFPVEKRVEWLKKVCSKYPSVTVDFYQGMLVDYARQKGIFLIVKGVRNGEDFLYEKEMAEYNDKNAGTLTVFLPAGEGLEQVSSTAVRQALAETGEGLYLPDEIAREVVAFSRKKILTKTEKNSIM